MHKILMSWKEKIKEELKSLGMIMFYFGIWFAFMIVIKTLLLREYNIEFSGLSTVFIGALIVGKVILIVDHIPFGSWIENKPAYVDIFFRTFVYSIGIIIIMIIEKAFELRHEAGGFFNAIPHVFKDTDSNHFYVNSITVLCALLGYNILNLFAKYFGKGGFRKILSSPPPLISKEKDNNK